MISGEKVCGYGRKEPDCTTCQQDYYTANCARYCVDISERQFCNKTTGLRTCLNNWVGKQCDTCKADYYGSDCSVHCVAVPGTSYNLLYK